MITNLKGPAVATVRPHALDLPARMRVLYISTTHRTGGWLAEALAIDSATTVDLEEAAGSAAGLARLRDEVFDAVLVSHQPDELDAMELIEAYRTGVADAPIVVLGAESEREMVSLCHELGADAYVCVNATTTRNLLWALARAIERHRLSSENQRLVQGHQRRMQQERDEAARLLDQQRALVGDLDKIYGGAATVDSPDVDDEDACGRIPPPGKRRAVALPAELVDHYRELLRAHVIMGSGNVASEMKRLARLLISVDITAREAMELHLHVLEELIQGLGARSTRHVMIRADLLALEIMMHLAEGYRAQYRQRVHPDVQRCLPGFEGATPAAF
ncbi:MAG TPA: response regulator [Thermoguttaceae bacterium]|nr:response regulator [Thermoguttaceae bacterium]